MKDCARVVSAYHSLAHRLREEKKREEKRRGEKEGMLSTYQIFPTPPNSLNDAETVHEHASKE